MLLYYYIITLLYYYIMISLYCKYNNHNNNNDDSNDNSIIIMIINILCKVRLAFWGLAFLSDTGKSSDMLQIIRILRVPYLGAPSLEAYMSLSSLI